MKQEIRIDALSHDGRGIGRLQGKTVFVSGTLPGDRACIRIARTHAQYDEADLIEIIEASENRVSPFCPLYETCGGCQLQHIHIAAQRRWKEEHFNRALSQAVDTRRCEWQVPIVGADQGYRRRAHFFLGRDGGASASKLGFRQSASHRIVDVDHCPLLTPALNTSLKDIRSQRLTSGSRNVKRLTAVDALEGVIWSEPVEKSSMPETEMSSTPSHMPEAHYEAHGITFGFPSQGFIQVNAEVNDRMVQQALTWLNLSSELRVLDAFSGVGNFTLPIGKHVSEVVGIEGDRSLVTWALKNAQQNGVGNARFYVEDLFKPIHMAEWFRHQTYDRVLLDPGRPGAHLFSQHIGTLNPEVVVYVSCNAATLIRDVKVMEQQGYRLTKAGFMDMFPHTAHSEVMVQMTRSTGSRQTASKKTAGSRKSFRF